MIAANANKALGRKDRERVLSPDKVMVDKNFGSRSISRLENRCQIEFIITPLSLDKGLAASPIFVYNSIDIAAPVD
jgi:hypothetical protein